MFCLLAESLALFSLSVKADAAAHQQDNSQTCQDGHVTPVYGALGILLFTIADLLPKLPAFSVSLTQLRRLFCSAE